MYLEVFYELSEKLKRSDMIFKKGKFPRFPSFRFRPIPKIENSEISEILFTLNYDTDYNPRFKNKKNQLRQKLKGSNMI